MELFRQGMLAFVLGLVVTLNVPVDPGAAILPVVAGLAVLVVAPNRWARWVGWLGVGVIWGAAAMAMMHEARPPRPIAARDVVVTGTVADLVATANDRTRFLIRPQAIEPYPEGRRLPKLIRLSWYGADQDVRAGERWRFSVRLERPRGLLNPVDFDYERYLASERIDAEGYVRAEGMAERLGTGASVDRLRSWVSEQLRAHTPEHSGAAVLRALTVGDRRAFDDELWDVFRATGTAHLVAISGLHIGLAAGLGWFAGSRLLQLWPWLNRRLPSRFAGGLAALAAAGVYAQLAGWAVPTVRALTMLGLAVAGMLARRWWSPWRVLAAAMAALALLQPWQLLSQGFWLSFAAVALILIAVQTAPLGSSRAALMIRLQGLLAAGMGVFTLVFFGQAAWLSLPVNLIAVPLFSLVLVPASLMAVLVVAFAPGTVAAEAGAGLVAGALELAVQGLTVASQTAGAVEPSNDLAPAAALAVALGSLWLRGVVALPVGLLAALLLVLPGDPPVAKPLRVTVLDVGQGLSVVVRTPEHTVVYDTGPSWGETAAARFSLWPYLENHGRTDIDELVISHRDEDHTGGWSVLKSKANVERVFVGESPDAGQRACRAGREWGRKGVTFRFLWPPAGSAKTGNASSCVLLVSYQGQRVLITGDVGRREEPAIAESLTEPVDAMVVPHHGSDDASSREFVAATSPALAIVASGYGNRYGLPDADVMARYRCQGSRVLNTATHGAITVYVNRRGQLGHRSRRRDGRRFYHEGLRYRGFHGDELIAYDPWQTLPACQTGTR
jgi:competence protein ComEC